MYFLFITDSDRLVYWCKFHIKQIYTQGHPYHYASMKAKRFGLGLICCFILLDTNLKQKHDSVWLNGSDSDSKCM